MDTISFIIYEKIKEGEDISIKEICLYLFLLPFISFILSKIKDFDFNFNLSKVKFWNNFKQKDTLKLTGREILNGSFMNFDYPESMIALNYWLIENKKLKKFRIFDTVRNQDIDYGYGKKKSENIGYIPDKCSETKIEEDIYITIDVNNINIESKNATITGTETIITLSSKNRNLPEFLDTLKIKYEKVLKNKNNGKLYHFIYQGINDETIKFTKTIISDKVNPSHETFNNIMNEHTDNFIKDIKRLKDLDYYCRTGLKRKKGYLFYGQPGCGKTASVMAMALEDNRHIIEIPLSRVKTNKEIEDILNLSKIQDIDFTKEEIIILFDEIDCGNDAIKIRDNKILEEENKKIIEMIKTDTDQLNLGMMLCRLDGIGNYNGLIIVATTNHKDKLDPALYRELRLTPILFDYARKKDIITMIEKFYNIQITDKQKINIPDRDAKITPAKVRYLLEKYEDSLDNLLSNLH